jgi:RNA-directed DNA polymerase
MKWTKSQKWHQIPWKEVCNYVSGIQCDIGVAKRKGELALMMKLQHTLVTSFEARALAVRKVASHHSGTIPGVDSQLLDSPVKRWEEIQRLGEIVLNLDK